MSLSVQVLAFLWLATYPPNHGHQCPQSEYLQPSLEQEKLLFTLDISQRTLGKLSQDLETLRQTPHNAALNVEVGLDYLTIANSENFTFLARAVEHFEIARLEHPSEATLLMYLGLATGSQALDMAPSVMKRLKLARQGFKYMDQAVAKAPNCVYLRMLRGTAQLLAHPVLRRAAALKEDADRVKAFMGSPEFERLPDFQKAKYHLFLGSFLGRDKKEDGEARQHWEQALLLAKESHVGREAASRLAGSHESVGYSGD
ncbi:hypothetical protein SCOR_20130 [Sulfidibacter corallicola]|uniref:Uncharacterized protein n=1 Tax=Sulfidibacter corallicola TaxID=2818388 RepID=A0A8A4TVQ7_SULCO|nr:hypothetical protein [Sulfidibacter corallicola]QTD53248.1 hypothetical protein J3U87_12400 [Sulfidibacter corallicola]